MTRRLRLFVWLVVLSAALPISGSSARAGGSAAVVAGEVRVDATFEHLGVVWEISGDDDLDSTMTLEFRETGATSWQPAAPAMRSYPDLIVNGSPLGLNRWAASAMFLTPGQTYDLRLTLNDPDGGGETVTVTGTTRLMPSRPSSERIRYVAPGSGGGSGTASDPFLGLQAAADAAVAGDTFLIAPGTYPPFQVLASGSAGAPITFQADRGPVIIDGAGTDRGVVTIGEFDQITSYVIVDGLTIRDGAWGIDAQHTQNIVIQNNQIEDVDDGIVNRRGDASEANQTVCGNRIVGRTPWPGSGIPAERGIDLRGTGNVVCNNLVSNFGDCVSVQPSTGPSYGNDVYGNDATYCVDDGIEIDYNQANARVWRNRVTNARMGVSVQPIAGGPAYIFRNAFFNLESAPVKMHNETTGFFVAHNTGVKVGNGYGDNGAMWRNVVLRNNVFIGTRYAFEFTTVRDEGFRDFDYNGWGTSGEFDPGGPWFKWENVRYDRLPDLPSGVEDHGLEVGFADLADAALPSDWDVAVDPVTVDLRLAPGSPAHDAGVVLSNLNDPYVADGAPDLGAFEAGQALPTYGPPVTAGPFADVPAGHLFATEITWLADRGITLGCNPPFNDLFCPNDPVSRAQMASFLVRALTLAASPTDYFFDDNGNTHEANINAMAQAGISLGCGTGEYCPTDPVTRAQMASFLVRALGLTAGTGADYFVDDDGNTHEDNIDRLRAASITLGCGTNAAGDDVFCPDLSVTRAQMAAFLYRALAAS